MPDPTRAQIQTSWSAAIKILNQTRLFGNVNATNFLGLLDTATQNARGDYLDEYGDSLRALRESLAGVVSQSSAAAAQRVWLKQYLKSVVGRLDVDSASDADLWEELFRYFIDNGLYVDSRRMTFGSATQTVGSGSIQIQRLTVDDYNLPIESGYGDSKRITCLVDQNTGSAQGNETWRIVGQARARDELQRSGSGAEGTFAGLTIDDSLLNNAGFRTFGGTAGSDAPTSLSGWTSTATLNSTNFGIDQTNYYRTAPSDGTPGSLVMKATATLTQKLTVRGTELDRTRPYLMAVIWNRAVNSATGTLSCQMGSITTSVTLAAQTGWNVTLVPSPIGQSCWYRNFYQSDLQIGIGFTRTGGTGLLVAEVLFVPGSFFDGLWHWMMPTSAASWTPPKYKDEFTIIDGESAAGGVNQRWLARAGFGKGQSQHGGYLPSSNGSSISWADA